MIPLRAKDQAAFILQLLKEHGYEVSCHQGESGTYYTIENIEHYPLRVISRPLSFWMTAGDTPSFLIGMGELADHVIKLLNDRQIFAPPKQGMS